MPDIRYVCLSDTHFGAYNSLLTNIAAGTRDPEPLHPSPAARDLTECLRYLAALNPPGSPRPTLVLNGDTLEFALNTENEAVMAFLRFFELIAQPNEPPIFEKIIVLPGNHDHHLWELSRETQYLNHISGMPLDTFLPAAWHATSMFVKPSTKSVPDCFLLNLLSRYPQVRENPDFVTIFYPNYGLLTPNRARCVVFHHGHFMEPMYQLMSLSHTLIAPGRPKPIHPWDIEAENFAWIDFFWSTMGRSGDVGQEIGLLYERLQDEKRRKEILVNLSKGLASQYDLPGWGDRFEARLAQFCLNAVTKHVYGLERLKTAKKPLSDEADEAVRAYIEGPLRQQILIELSQTMPPDVTVVFGHTHKPFEKDISYLGYPSWVGTYNSGGWVVDTIQREPQHGASIVLVDDELNTAAIRMYQESDNPRSQRVKVCCATHASFDCTNPLFELLRARVDADERPWRRFSQTVVQEVCLRAEILRSRIQSPG